MSTGNAFWHLENIDVTSIFCPLKVKAGQLDSHPHRTVQRGEFIFLPDSEADKVFLILDGRVKIGAIGNDEKEITKAILNPGDVFGELSLIGIGKHHDFAQAMEKTTLCALTMPEIRALMREYSGFGLFLMNIMGRRILDVERRLESLVFKDSRTRVVECLYRLGTDKGQRVGYEVVVRKFITHQEIANLTATSRQTVTTILNDLRNRNILTFDRKRLLIRDMERLKGEMMG